MNWIKQNGNFSPIEGDFSTCAQLPVGIYNVQLVPFKGWQLEKTQEKFEFPYKMYGLQTKFVEYVLETYRKSTGNLGILLNGTKGTGKTVTVKLLANKLNMPVIVAKSFGENNSSLIEFLTSINSDIAILFDEFEKNFSDQDSSILQIMDGVYTTDHRRVFLLTTNEKHINDNLISRPSRIRYIQEFGNLEFEVVKELLQDELEDKSVIDDVLAFIDELEISTIDILKTIISEINIHGFQKFIEMKKNFNVKFASHWISMDYGYFYMEDREELFRKIISDPDFDVFSLYEKQRDLSRERMEVPDLEKEFGGDGEKRQAWINEWYKKHRTEFNWGHDYFESDVVIKNLKPGMSFWRRDVRVTKIDHKKGMILAMDDESVYVMKISNPNERPSLYMQNPCYPMQYLDI